MMLDRPVPINRLVGSIADSACLCSARAAALNSLIAWRASLVLFAEAQVNTQVYGRRPYGVGFLVVGQDVSRPDPPALPSCWQGRSLIAAALPLQDLGPHLFEFSPSGNSFEYVAMSIGARSQSAKTYLEKNFESFPEGAYAGRTLADPVGTPLLTECLLTYCIRPCSRPRHAHQPWPPGAARNAPAGQGADDGQHVDRDCRPVDGGRAGAGTPRQGPQGRLPDRRG
jgi:hypothetical protein